MFDDGWDVTKVASAHSALAGVLAGLAMVVLAIFLDRGDAPPAGGSRSAATWEHTVRFLLFAVCALIVAAIEWGALGGYPSEEALKERDTDTSIQPGAEVMQAFLDLLAWASVVMLVCGALALLASMVDLISFASPARPGTRSTGPVLTAQRAFAAMAVLATYEVLVFASTAIREASSEVRGVGCLAEWNGTPALVAFVVGCLAVLGQSRHWSAWILARKPTGRYRWWNYSSIRGFAMCVLLSLLVYNLSDLESLAMTTFALWVLVVTTVFLLMVVLVLTWTVGEEGGRTTPEAGNSPSADSDPSLAAPGADESLGELVGADRKGIGQQVEAV